MRIRFSGHNSWSSPLPVPVAESKSWSESWARSWGFSRSASRSRCMTRRMYFSRLKI